MWKTGMFPEKIYLFVLKIGRATFVMRVKERLSVKEFSWDVSSLSTPGAAFERIPHLWAWCKQ